MSPTIATIIYLTLIAGLFYLARESKARTSPALWIAVVWMWLACSRAASQWLATVGLGGQVWTSSTPDQYLNGSPLDRNVLSVLVASGLLVLYQRRRKVRSILVANMPTLLFFSYCALSICWSDYPEVAIKRWVKALGNVVMVLIVLTDPDQLSAIKRILSRVGFIMIPLSILFIKYYPAIGRGYNPSKWEPFFAGVTDNKNGLGTICLILGTGSVWRIIQLLEGGARDRMRHLLAQVALVLMALWLLWKADSMTSMACLVIASGLMVATTFRSIARRPGILHALTLSTILVSLYALLLDTGGGMVATLGRNPTLTGRTDLWQQVIALSGNPFVGTGFESFWLGSRIEKLWSMYWWHPNEAHNGYLEIYLTLGWIGVSLMAVVMVAGYRNAVAAFRQNPEFGRLMLAFFAATAVYNLTEAGFKGTDPIWYVFIWACMVVPGVKKKDVPLSSSTALAGVLPLAAGGATNPVRTDVDWLSRSARPSITRRPSRFGPSRVE